MFGMAADHLVSLFLLFIFNTGFSAEISVFVQTGDSVQLDLQTQPLPEFDYLSWINDKSENIVRYLHESKMIRYHLSYQNRIEFNETSFSLTLKNMQKADSGLYTARISGDLMKDIAVYRVSVIDAVDSPVLTVNSTSSDSCTVNFTCRAQHLIIDSSYQNNQCSPEEVTSQENYTLILSCSEELIICNYSNPVSWKKEEMEIKPLCSGNEQSLFSSAFPLFHMMLLTVISVAVIEFWGLIF
ncbi:CD48 antigen-like isoform X2 [Danio rerio]|uniref:CD48 antigen-like isoform X1 n=1 Tax=Danio rerio TaxID=7955 RepID=A0A8M9P1V5_DANRE|nr:SLAM family member 9-like isoform X1 [Danio rerio]XP_021323769.1 SLAM family member 9-like isoform X1 [Danio rerio]XP_021323770.1 SLAM family member 9-like isoform X1 [Danio rerio]|eukprot:XP_021323767.1 SLAM family member 9-like isoform X1 [Danio rerio]